jgi:histidyl-tRNA synthetase
VREQFARLARYFEFLDALGVGEWATFDLSIVRGLAYYTGIVFELFDARGQFRAICGGGRYDTLLQALGGADLPALGFGMGDVVLGELLRERGLVPRGGDALDYWVAGADDVPLATTMRVATELRRRRLRVEYALRPQRLPRQLKAASGANAAKVVIIRDAGEATIRRLSDGEERPLRLDAFLRRRRAGGAAPEGGPGAADDGDPWDSAPPA